LSDEFARAGYEVEAVAIDTRRRPARLTVIADGDTPPDLAAVTELSRVASERLDTIITGDDEYLLEVTSRGVDRPLTSDKHFRRARGRVAEFTLSDGSTFVGRIGELVDGTLSVVTTGRHRSDLSVQSVTISDVTKAVVQVEFTSPSKEELELAGVTGEGSESA
jgi:ribosome maturation factor RimP